MLVTMLRSIFILFYVFASGSGYELKQVIILSRHNIRAPIVTNLEEYTPKKWPTWNIDNGILTPKGQLLERSMGKYLVDWMREKKLLGNCSKDRVFLYANNKQRTIESAKSFAEGAFGDCVDVYHKNITREDPVFQFKRNPAMMKDMFVKEAENKSTNIALKNAFSYLEKILDFRSSLFCKTRNICELTEAKSDVMELNEIPNVLGAIGISVQPVDVFLMAYYDGMSTKDVAWGQIQTPQQWDTLLRILNAFQELVYSDNFLSKYSTLSSYLTNIFRSGNKKFYLLVGHDYNIMSLMYFLSFKKKVLRDQFESVPIGGKIVFQKWYDDRSQQDLLRVNYVYQSTDQIRNCVEASLQDPPLWEILEMDHCPIDNNGFCLWNDFITSLNTL